MDLGFEAIDLLFLQANVLQFLTKSNFQGVNMRRNGTHKGVSMRRNVRPFSGGQDVPECQAQLLFISRQTRLPWGSASPE